MDAIEIKRLTQEFEAQFEQTWIEKAEELHKQFIEKYTLEKLQNMSLEEYALGKTKKGSFCWWLEYNTHILGSIKGGSASKLIIYYSVNDNEWKFPTQFSSVDEAWQALRKSILDLIEAYQEEPYQEIADNSLLSRANMLKGKILYLYYPDKFLPIYSIDHLQKYLLQFGLPQNRWADMTNIELNLMLKDHLAGYDAFKDWPTLKIARFLYTMLHKKPRYFKIAPGQNAVNWGECMAGNYISLGWDDVGDLSAYPDYDEFLSAFRKIYPEYSQSKATEKAKEMWSFYSLNPGDRILVNKGKSKILAHGTVVDKGYEFNDTIDSFKHLTHVNWDHCFDPPLDIRTQEYWGVKTVLELKEKEFKQLIEGKSIVSTGFTSAQERFYERLDRALEYKGQCILYGPPGTGKTYLANNYINWKNKDVEGLNMAKPSKKTWMMVASSKHAFQWEDILDSGGSVDYELRNIRSNFYRAQAGEIVICYRGGDTNRAFVGLAEIAQPFKDGVLEVKGLRSFQTPIDYDLIKDESAYLKSQAGRVKNRGTMFEVNDELLSWFIDHLTEAGDREVLALLVQDELAVNYEICTFHPSFNYEDFIEGYKPIESAAGQITFDLENGIFLSACEKALKQRPRPYYLIIDEINRGNIPKIFGDTITLLEKDKREVVEVRLPQSKNKLTVPDNLFIIGTMNTADRSIKIMDAALKRRFTFIECATNYSLIDKPIDELGLSPAELLKSINSSLLRFGGRDKLIGHAYFMRNSMQVNTVEELKQILELEIIPLIQEYCFDDYEELEKIIGSGFVNATEMKINTELFEQQNDIFIAEVIKQFKGVLDEEEND